MAKSFMLNNVRLSYEHIFTPSAFDDSQQAKYSATVIIPKDHPDLPALKRAFADVGKEQFPTAFNGNAWPKGYTCALRDADVERNQNGELLCEKNPEYSGSYVLMANSTKRPPVYDRNKAMLTEADGRPYSGCYVNVALGVAGYEYGKIKKGVKAYLNGIQFAEHGERFGVDVMNMFSALDGEDNEFMV